MAVGSGYVYLSLLGTLLILVVLNYLTYFEKFIDRHHKIREYKIAVVNYHDIQHCEELFKRNHLKFTLAKQQYTQGNLSTTWVVTGNNKNHEILMKNLMEDDKIIAYQF
jgi:putative Mg2+ transporter-C (MgtC) family protein